MTSFSYLGDDDFLGLSDSMTAVKALLLNGWVPGLCEEK
jgi:hypothetical protein